jgi:hypothetical protein
MEGGPLRWLNVEGGWSSARVSWGYGVCIRLFGVNELVYLGSQNIVRKSD